MRDVEGCTDIAFPVSPPSSKQVRGIQFLSVQLVASHPLKDPPISAKKPFVHTSNRGIRNLLLFVYPIFWCSRVVSSRLVLR